MKTVFRIFLGLEMSLHIVRHGADLKNKCLYPDGSCGLFLPYRKKIGSVTHIHTQLLWSLLFSSRFVLLTYCFIHTWVARRWQHRSEWVHPCFFLKEEWGLSLTTWDRMLISFKSVVSLGRFSMAWLDLAADRHPNSNASKSHRYTSWPKQNR
jgi:hypothetical protein